MSAVTFTWQRIWRFGATSVMNVAITQALLLGFYTSTSMGAVPANILAVGLSSLPGYVVNRRWVWGRTGRHSVRREIAPFWAYSFAGLAVSTVAVGVIERRWHSGLAVSAANIGAFGVLWVAKFVLLDRWMFAQADDEPAASAQP